MAEFEQHHANLCKEEQGANRMDLNETDEVWDEQRDVVETITIEGPSILSPHAKESKNPSKTTKN